MDNIWNAVKEIHPDSYIVGGWVRDKLLGYEPRDIDFACVASSYDGVYNKFSEHFKVIPKGKTHNTFVFFSEKEQYEVTVVDTIAKHLASRDFTINSLAIDSNGELLDVNFSMLDIETLTLRASNNTAIQSDPIRAMRGIRFQNKYGLKVESDTNIDIWSYLINYDWHKESKYRFWTELSKHENPFILIQGFSVNKHMKRYFSEDIKRETNLLNCLAVNLEKPVDFFKAFGVPKKDRELIYNA